MKIFGSKPRVTTLSPQHALLDIYKQAGLNGFTLPPELALKHVDAKKMPIRATASPMVKENASGHEGINDAYVLLITYISETRGWGINPHRYRRSIALSHTFIRYIRQTYIERVQAAGDLDHAARLYAKCNLFIASPLLKIIDQDRLPSFHRESSFLTYSFSQIDESSGGLIALALRSTDGVDRERQHKKLAAHAVTMYELYLAAHASEMRERDPAFRGHSLADIQREMC